MLKSLKNKLKDYRTNLINYIRNAPLSDYVVFSISILILYTIVEFIFSTLTNSTHDTLTTCVFGTFGGEILTCAIIKIYKLKENKEDGC